MCTWGIGPIRIKSGVSPVWSDPIRWGIVPFEIAFVGARPSSDVAIRRLVAVAVNSTRTFVATGAKERIGLELLGIDSMGGLTSGRIPLKCEGLPKACLLAVEWGPLLLNVTPQYRPDGQPTVLSVYPYVYSCIWDEEFRDLCRQ